MNEHGVRIGVMAPGGRIDTDIAERVKNLAAERYSDRIAGIEFHPQCFLSSGHFAGDDAARARAFVDMANDPSLDAVWFARGGYGACRIAEAVLPELTDAARRKVYLGYSDAGYLLAALYKHHIGRAAHGPMPVDISRTDGEVPVARALAYLAEGDARDMLEPTVSPSTGVVAFNMSTLSHLLGTPLQPDLSGHVLMLEEVSEYMYRIDRLLFHITSDPGVRRCAGIRLGRCSEIPENDRDFGQNADDLVRYWCEKAGIPYLGVADIGHDIQNKIVPFGRAATV